MSHRDCPVIALRPAPNPLARLEALPGHWRGRAWTRREFAREALAQGLDRLADEHFRAANEYELRVKESVA